MEQSPYWKANRISAIQEITRLLWKQNVHYRIHKRPSLLHIFSQTNQNAQRLTSVRSLDGKYLKSEAVSVSPDPPHWRNILCWALTTGHSVYCPISSISGGHSSIRKLQTWHAVVTVDIHSYDYDGYASYKAKCNACKLQTGFGRRFSSLHVVRWKFVVQKHSLLSECNFEIAH